MRWLSVYNCSEDPFTAKPLTTSSDMNYFYQTEKLKEQLAPILDRNEPGIYGISGKRGVGKTSTLHYIGNYYQKKNDIVITIRIVEDLSKKISTKTISINLINQLIETFIREIHENYPEVFSKYERFFQILMDEVGMEFIEDYIFVVKKGSEDYNLYKKHVIQMIGILNKNGYNVSILIDNLDKYLTHNNRTQLIEFLCGPFAQSFFEDIISASGKVFISLSDEVYNYLKSGSDKWAGLNYLTSTIELDTLRDIEAAEILSWRFKRVSALKLPFASGSIEFLNSYSNSILRTLLWNSKYTLQYGASKSIDLIKETHLRQMLKVQDIYKITTSLKNENSDFRNSIIWLLDIIRKNSDKNITEIEKSLSTLSMYHISKKIKPNEDERKILIDLEIIDSENYEINNENFLYLISTLSEREIDITDWLKWYLKIDFNFKNINAYGEPIEQKFNRLLFYVNNHNFNNLIKLLDRREKKQIGMAIKGFVITDIETIIDIYKRLNMIKIEEGTDDELFSDIAKISYLFLRLSNNILYSFFDEIMDFHEHGSTIELFKHINTKYLSSKYHTSDNNSDILENIIFMRKREVCPTSGEIKREFIKCKSCLIELIDAIISVLQTSNRDTADRTISDEIPVVEAFSSFLRLSTGNWAQIWIEGYSPGRLNILLWNEGEHFFTISSGFPSEFQKYFDMLRPTTNASDIAKSVWMGNAALDSSIIVSKDIYQLIDLGIFRRANIIIPPSVYADIKYTNSSKVKENITLSIDNLKRKCNEKSVTVIEDSKIPQWMNDAVKGIHPSLISTEIDSLFIQWAKKVSCTAIIGDRGNIADFSDNMQTFWLLPNSEIILTHWESIREIFDFIKRSLEKPTLNFCINEISGMPLVLGKIQFSVWDSKFTIQY